MFGAVTGRIAKLVPQSMGKGFSSLAEEAALRNTAQSIADASMTQKLGGMDLRNPQSIKIAQGLQEGATQQVADTMGRYNQRRLDDLATQSMGDRVLYGAGRLGARAKNIAGGTYQAVGGTPGVVMTGAMMAPAFMPVGGQPQLSPEEQMMLQQGGYY